MSEIDEEGVAKIREIAVALGRTIYLTHVAAEQTRGVKAVDKAWTKLADKIIEFAMED